MAIKQEKRERIEALRQQLANLTDQDKQALTSRGLIATVEGRTLSYHNTLLVYLQCNGQQPSVVGGYKQWLRAGKQVIKGQHGFMIWFPIGEKDKETGDITDATHFYTGTVFDISQVQDKGIERQPEPPQALPLAENNMEGWSVC